MGWKSEEYQYLFDKDFISIQDYIHQFNEGISIVKIDEVKSEKDLIEQLSLQVKMYGTKIIELYEALDQCSSTDRPYSFEKDNIIQELENERAHLLEREKLLAQEIRKVTVFSEDDNNWEEIETALQEAFSVQQNFEEGCELLQTLDYRINTSNLKQLCLWLAEANRLKDRSIEHLRQVIQVDHLEDNFEQTQETSFFESIVEIQKRVEQIQKNATMLIRQIRELEIQPEILNGKIEYLNQQLSENNKRNPGFQQVVQRLQDQLNKEIIQKEKYERDLQIICSQYESLKSQKEQNHEIYHHEDTLKDQLEDIQNDLSRFRDESTICNMEEIEKMKDAINERERKLDESSVEITYLKQKINEQNFENKLIVEEEEKKWEKKQLEMLEGFKKQIQEEKQRDNEIKLLTSRLQIQETDNIKLKQELNEVSKQKDDLLKNLEELKRRLEEHNYAKQQVLEAEIENLKEALFDIQKKQDFKHESIEWGSKCQELIKDNEKYQEGLEAVTLDLEQKSNVINSLQDELFQMNEDLRTSKQQALILQNQYEEFIDEKIQKEQALETENINLKQSLRNSESELTECKITIQSMNVQFEKFKNTQMDKIKILSESVTQIKEQGDKQLDLKEKEIKQLRQAQSNSEELILHYEEALNIREEKMAYSQSNRLLKTSDLQNSFGESKFSLSNSGNACTSEDLFNRLTKYKRTIIKLKEKQFELSRELEASKKNLTEALHQQKDLESKYIQIQSETAKIRLHNHQLSSKDSEISSLESQRLIERIDSLQKENDSLRFGIFSKDNTFKELEKIMSVNEELLKEIDSLKQKLNNKEIEFCKERSITKQQISDAHKKMDELQRKVEESCQKENSKAKVNFQQKDSEYSKKSKHYPPNLPSPSPLSSRSTHRSTSSTYRTVFSDVSKDLQETYKNNLKVEDLHLLLGQKNQEIDRLNQIVKSIHQDSQTNAPFQQKKRS